MYTQSLCTLLHAVISLSASTRVHTGSPYDECNIEDGVEMGQMDDHVIEEASGLAVNGRTPGLLWTHTDHGGPAQVYAITEQGLRIADVELEGVKNSDWEDIAISVEDGQSFLYVADTGNNDHDKEALYIYRFLGPEITAEKLKIPREEIDVIQVSYPDC